MCRVTPEFDMAHVFYKKSDVAAMQNAELDAATTDEERKSVPDDDDSANVSDLGVLATPTQTDIGSFDEQGKASPDMAQASDMPGRNVRRRLTGPIAAAADAAKELDQI